jgi:hypothetical protein
MSTIQQAALESVSPASRAALQCFLNRFPLPDFVSLVLDKTAIVKAYLTATPSLLDSVDDVSGVAQLRILLELTVALIGD